MKKILFSLFALILFNSCVNAKTFKFAQVTDVHYPKTGIAGYEGRSFDFAIKNYNKAIDMINDSDVEYVFFTGDIVDKSFKEVFDDLFTNILPAVKGVHAGDMTITDLSGNDTRIWENTLFNQTGQKTGLEPTARYIRLYLTCQPEPIYINIGNLLEEITNGYNVASSDTVTFEVDDMNNTLYAHINVINESQLKELGIKQ
jgi:hypothetical protein